MQNSEEMKKEYRFQDSTNEQLQALGSCLNDKGKYKRKVAYKKVSIYNGYRRI